MKRFSWALGVFALVLGSQVSKADTFDFSFNGLLYGGSGTITATAYRKTCQLGLGRHDYGRWNL